MYNIVFWFAYADDYPLHKSFHCILLSLCAFLLEKPRLDSQIQKRILHFFTKKIPKNPLWARIQWPLMHHDPSDLGLICLVKKRKIRF